jgi:hypothetical protein
MDISATSVLSQVRHHKCQINVYLCMTDFSVESHQELHDNQRSFCLCDSAAHQVILCCLELVYISYTKL